MWAPSYELFCDKQTVALNLRRQSLESSYIIVPFKSSMFVLFHIWKVTFHYNKFVQYFTINRGDSDAHFEKSRTEISSKYRRLF